MTKGERKTYKPQAMKTNPWKLLEQYPGPIVEALAALTREKSSACYIAGGTIRDWFMGVESQDLDITVDRDSFGWAGELARKLGGTFVPMDVEEDVARALLHVACRQHRTPLCETDSTGCLRTKCHLYPSFSSTGRVRTRRGRSTDRYYILRLERCRMA